jgi:hypothetical protein
MLKLRHSRSLNDGFSMETDDLFSVMGASEQKILLSGKEFH